MDNSRDTRIKFLFITCAVWIFVLALTIVNWSLTWADFWGWLVGGTLGLFAGYKYSKLLDFEKMQPKKPINSEIQESSLAQKQSKWVLAIPLGVIVGNIIARYFAPGVGSLITSIIASFFCIALTYIAIQVLRGLQ